MRGEGSKGEKGVGGYCSGGTCHNDRPGLKGGEDKGGDEDGIEVEWGCWLQGGRALTVGVIGVGYKEGMEVQKGCRW